MGVGYPMREFSSKAQGRNAWVHRSSQGQRLSLSLPRATSHSSTRGGPRSRGWDELSPEHPRPLPHASGSHSPAFTPLGIRPDRPRRVVTPGPGAVCPGPSGEGGPTAGRSARLARERRGPRILGVAGGGSSSSSSTSGSGGGHRGARGEAMVAAAARAHMPGAGPRAAARGAGCERAFSRKSCANRGRVEAAPAPPHANQPGRVAGRAAPPRLTSPAPLGGPGAGRGQEEGGGGLGPRGKLTEPRVSSWSPCVTFVMGPHSGASLWVLEK